MSEPIKNTLFRFATMRTPELIPEKEKRDYHIHHPNPTTTGFFASAFANPAATQAAQLAALTTLAAGFTPLTTTAAAKTYVTEDFFNFSVWLAKNHTAVFKGTAAAYNGTMPTVLNSTKQLAIWDNFFYQLITGNSPQLRQFCIEFLVANGYIAAENASWKNQVAVARVVIPSAFYGTGAANMLAPFAPEAANDQSPAFYKGDHKKMLAAVIANEKIKSYNNLLQELKQAEKKYVLTNDAAFNTARKAYEQSVKQIINDFNIDQTGIPPTDKPAGPDIPDFEFIPAPEMDADFLEAKLTQDSFALAAQMNLTGNTNFTEAFEKISAAISAEAKKTEVLNSNTNQSIVLNNMVFPVNNGANIITPLYSYYLESLFLLNPPNSIVLYCSLYMGVPDEHIVSAQYHAVINGTTFSGTAFTEHNYGNYLYLGFYSPAGLQLPAGLTSFRFHGSIQTAGSLTLFFDIQHQVHPGAYGIMEVEEGEGGGQTINPPSGYGIKRIGLADYRRVEQSVCCYLPGEVSHIENVMAREYKERSSRRLTRSEDTTVFEKAMEKETQKDHSSTERYELQKEIDSVITKDMSVDAHANVRYEATAKLTLDAGAGFAYNTSREDSNHTAVNYSKEVTEKALERVVLKIREERTIKIIEEFEEQNKHGLDNRLGDQHISGVYRWIDKVYKNQVFNYGKRLMYEFVIPQPASFHNQAIKLLSQQQVANVLLKPIDPRTANAPYKMDTPTNVNNITFPYWTGVYNVEVKAAPDELINISEAFGLSSQDATGDPMTAAKSFKMEIPEGYEATSAFAGMSYVLHGGNTSQLANIRIGNSATVYLNGSIPNREISVGFASFPVRKSLAVSAESRNLGGVIINVIAYCRRTTEAYANWQLEVFNAIMEAYNEKLDAYNKAIAAVKQPDTVKQLNPGFYRQIENTVLRKNCITYLVSDGNMGKKFYGGTTTGDTLPIVDADMDKYASMVKFIEQAFEWEIMSYKFYPFYWGDRSDWQKNYQIECDDPIFRSFLQAGMARAIVSIRPGFEEAVMYFMATGQIWNGGKVPAIGDDMYLSIVEELKNPEYYIDETWETRVPTTLTVIQSGNIGLQAEGLPCACGDENDVEQNEHKLGNQLENMVNP